MKVCVISLYTEEIKNESHSAILNKKSYCEKYGLEYRFYYGRASKRHAQWDKIQCLIQNILEFDWVIWIDADAVFNNFNISFVDIINKDSNYDALFCHDICYSPGINHLLVNTGVMVFKNTAWSRKVLLQTWNSISDYKIDTLSKHSYDGYPHEQGSLCEILLKQNPSKFKIHRSDYFNAHPNVSDQNTFIIHFMGSRETQKKLDEFKEKTQTINVRNGVDNNENFEPIKLRNFKICLVSHYTSQIEKVAILSTNNKEKYCNKHEYDLIINNKRLSRRHPAWDKIILLRDLMSNQYDYLVWVDNDAFIMEDEYRFDFICNNYQDKNLIICAESDIPESLREVDYNVLSNLRIINTGVFIIKNNKWSKKLLDDVWYTKSNTNNGFKFSHADVEDENISYEYWPFEQGPFHIVLSNQDPKYYKVVTSKTMNSFKQNFDRGEFICHFVGEGRSHDSINNFLEMIQTEKSIIEEKQNKYLSSMTDRLLTGENKITFAKGYAILDWSVYKWRDNILLFHFYWDLKYLGQQHLSHNFRIINKKNDREICFNSISEGSFEFEYEKGIKILHTYEFFGEKDWNELLTLDIEYEII